jgi:hypothetical protein
VENNVRMIEHDHGRNSHIHAWGDTPHNHLLRAICNRPECIGVETHNIHRTKRRI